MTNATVVLKTQTILQLPDKNSLPSVLKCCTLIWEEDTLIITPAQSGEKADFPALQNRAWLRACLERSLVRQVYLDPALPKPVIEAWADVCESSGKLVYLRVPPAPELPRAKRPQPWWIKRLADRLAAPLLLAVISPVLLLVAVTIRLESQGPVIFRQWRVGTDGKLFRIYKFRSMHVNAEAQHHDVMGDQKGLHKLEHDPRVTRVGRWLRKLSLDELPQLFNVVRGEMSLVGPRPWAVYDAVRIAPELQGRLNALPGITGPWQVSERSNELDLYAVTCRDLGYLQSWQLRKDLGILLLTIPKAVFGVGAY